MLVPHSPIDESRPLLRSDAVAAGISDAVLRSQWQAVFHGVHIAPGKRLTVRLRCECALTPFVQGESRAAYLSHASAARLHDVPIPTLPEEHVTVPTRVGRRKIRGIKCHLNPAGSSTRVQGLPASTCPQMFVELATLLSLVDLVVVGDHLVRRGKATLTELHAYVSQSALPGTQAAKLALGYVREDVDSVMETKLRMLIVLAGLPEPQINLKICADDGTLLRRYDLSYPEIRFIIEYDGRQHVEIIENWENDILRREAIESDQWRIMTIIASDIYKKPGETVQRIWRILKSRHLPGVPSRPSEAWRAHFPGY